ncbi:hypothetical protein LVJ94_35220 [Pendulispora rubella]|uniref:Uncharacterized protein n=1 Tax=Pendulispora rubella TaxID=2741070 RepID=A0ABZ2KU10_9BACT
MTTKVLGSYRLAEVNIGAAGALTVLNPALGQLELLVHAGLGSVLGDLAAQLSAALSLQSQIAVQIANPLAALEEALRAAVQLVAQLTATLAVGIPVIAVQASASVGATAALAAKVGGLQAMMDAALAVKAPAEAFVAGLAGHLSAGPIVLLSVGADEVPDTLSSAGRAIDALCQGGVEGIAPQEQVYGLVLLTKAPSAWAALGATMRTS